MLAGLFYRQPRLTILTVAVILAAGLAAFQGLARQEDPQLIDRYGHVATYFPGASALRVEALITEKIEAALAEIKEIKEINSRSQTGVSSINISLEEHVTAVDGVWSRVRNKLLDVRAELPAGASSPEFKELTTTAFTLLVALKWEAGGAPQLDILHRQAKDLERRLIALPGTRETEFFGAPQEEMLVSVDPALLAAANLTIAEVSQAIARADPKAPAGQVRAGGSDLVVALGGILDSVDRIRRVPIRETAEGRLLRVGDVALVEKAALRPPADLALIDGRRAVLLAVKMEGDVRIDRWAAAARRVVEGFAAELPRGVRADIVFDQSGYTEERLADLAWNLILGALIVVLTLFACMGLRVALIVAAALPLTVAAVLPALRILDVPLHQISVTGLVVALGMLIDNAIIAVDEYRRFRRLGDRPAEAVEATFGYLALPLAASTLTTVLTFMPLVLMPGNVGDFVRALGIGVSLSLVLSLALSLTVMLALAGYADRFIGGGRGAMAQGLSSARLLAFYERALDAVLQHPRLCLLLCLAVSLLGFPAATRMTEQFFPPVDRNQFHIQVKLARQTSIEEAERQALAVRERLHAHAEVIGSHWFIGKNPPKVFYNTNIKQYGTPSFAWAFVNTRSAEETRRLLPGLQREMRDAFPNAEILVLPFEQGPPIEAPIEVRVFGPDLDVLRQLGEELRLLLSGTRHVTYTTARIAGGRPVLGLEPDEDAARLAGLRLVDIAAQINAGLEGATGGTVIEAVEELPVRVRMQEEQRRSAAQLLATPVLGLDRAATPSGATAASLLPGVPLGAVMRPVLAPETDSITRRDGMRVNSVQAFVEPFVLPSLALADFKQRLAASGFRLPPGYRLKLGGEAAESADARGSLFDVVGVLAVLMVACIVMAFNSFRHAAVIGLIALQSVGLAFLSLWALGYPMGFMAIIGTMGMIGLAINDSIVVLSALKSDARARAGDLHAIREVVVDNTRHVVATTVSTLGGFLPLILWGGMFWPPLAMTICAGLVGATVLALTFVPCAFYLLAGGRRRPQPAPLAGGVAEAYS